MLLAWIDAWEIIGAASTSGVVLHLNYSNQTTMSHQHLLADSDNKNVSPLCFLNPNAACLHIICCVTVKECLMVCMRHHQYNHPEPELCLLLVWMSRAWHLDADALRAIANPQGPGRVRTTAGLGRSLPFFSIRASLAGANVFLTGATGYLGQLILEQLLRTVPELGCVFVLSRGKRDLTARQRINKWVGRPCTCNDQTK